jgi:hypothetical protein
VGGELRFSSDDVMIHGERGVAHTVEELAAVARGYWAAWSSKGR